jgi:hypothetical protein
MADFLFNQYDDVEIPLNMDQIAGKYSSSNVNLSFLNTAENYICERSAFTNQPFFKLGTQMYYISRI